MPSSTPSSAPSGPGPDRAKITSRKVVGLPERLNPADGSLPAWTERYLDLAVRGVRSAEVTAKISRHLQRRSPDADAAMRVNASVEATGTG
ncbi:hypothetical protein AB0M50_50425, partial [Nonomuraea fuscirosea]|uniref:hypothetical protein n=1 Tax=Nonomuraea fuscirosea TaxID=1291556 RepID=UPI00341C8524